MIDEHIIIMTNIMTRYLYRKEIYHISPMFEPVQYNLTTLVDRNTIKAIFDQLHVNIKLDLNNGCIFYYIDLPEIAYAL